MLSSALLEDVMLKQKYKGCPSSLQDMSLTSKYDHTHHSLPEPLLGLASLKCLSVRFPSLTSLQNGISRLTVLETLRIEGLQGTLVVEPGASSESISINGSSPGLTACESHCQGHHKVSTSIDVGAAAQCAAKAPGMLAVWACWVFGMATSGGKVLSEPGLASVVSA